MLVSPLLAGSMVYRVLGFFSRFSVCWFISFWISGPLLFTLVCSSIWFTWSRWFMWFRSSSWSCDQLLRPFIGLSGFGVSFPGFLSVSSFFLNFWFFSFDIGWFLNVVGSYSRLFRFNGLISSSSRLVQLGSSWSRDQFLRSFRHCQPSLGCIIIQTNIKEIFVNLWNSSSFFNKHKREREREKNKYKYKKKMKNKKIIIIIINKKNGYLYL